jgi:hypothetical protein
VVPTDGDGVGGCRGRNNDGTEHSGVMQHARDYGYTITSEEDCRSACLDIAECVAYEAATNDPSRCEIHAELVTHSAQNPPYICGVRASALDPALHTTCQPTSWQVCNAGCLAGSEYLAEQAGCVECPAGKSDVDQNPATACVDCEAGRYSDAVGVAVPAMECAGVCATGSHSVPGSSACIECPAGKSDEDRNPVTPCADCVAGLFSDAIGVVAECGGVCPIEYLSSHSPPGSTAVTACVEPLCGVLEGPCTLGYFCSFEEPGTSGTCAVCAAEECGCTDPVATNYRPGAVHLDASCNYDCDADGWTCIPATVPTACAVTSCAASAYAAQELKTRVETPTIIRYVSYSSITVRAHREAYYTRARHGQLNQYFVCVVLATELMNMHP